jgi:hypothetical protein
MSTDTKVQHRDLKMEIKAKNIDIASPYNAI